MELASRTTRSNHVVEVACWYKWLTTCQTGLAAIVLGLLWYNGPEQEWPGVSRFATFCTLYLAFTNLYYMVSAHVFPPAFNCWAYLILCCFAVLLWTTCWIDITMRTGILYLMPDASAFDPDSEDGQIAAYNVSMRPRWAAGAALSGLLAILLIVGLIIYGNRLHRHRTSGRPYIVNGRWRFRPDNDSYSLPSIARGVGQDPFATPVSQRSRITPSPVQEDSLEISPRNNLNNIPPVYAKGV